MGRNQAAESRRAVISTLAAAILGLALPAATAGQPPTGAIRPLQGRGARLVTAGVVCSATFRLLVDEIERSDLVVYVDLDNEGEPGLDGALQFVAAAGATRFVRVWLRAARIDDDLIVTLGHELQHAAELARAPQVKSPGTLVAFYSREGVSDHPGHFETRAAQDVAARIHQDLTLRHRGPTDC